MATEARPPSALEVSMAIRAGRGEDGVGEGELAGMLVITPTPGVLSLGNVC